ncbi:MAG: hypothetical protein CVU11_09425 [Bacteroidetes bacterium HGW-Bacteroidetes-6]|jgi:PKD repeat protein|nr:MAG: hypothetical protein CVU11_09425 [Bacteroidetes bacterium HGW-Bacteroidetes-6]
MKYSIALLLLLLSMSLFAQNNRPQYQDGKIWIKVRADYPVYRHVSFDGKSLDDPTNLPLKALAFVEKLAPVYQISKLSRPFYMARNYEPLENLYQVEFEDISNADKLLKILTSDPAVEYAEKVPMYYTDIVTPNDPYYNSSYAWGLYKINAGSAWDYSTGSSSVTVAVVDNAIEYSHSDLSPNIWVNPGEIASNGIDDDGNGYIDDVNGYDVADGDNDPSPPNTSFDHGTHVAGTVGARSNNSSGVASIGYGIRIIPVKSTTNASSPTSVTNGYDGIIYAANSGADVINMSWGGTTYSATGQNVINYAHNHGCVLVAAAGNDNVSTPHYPSSYNYVISVASTTSTDAKSSFSNYGADVDVSAPGSSIYSTLPGNSYGYMSGTSMASPLVAGLCGLMLSLNPGLSPEDVETCLENSCVNIDTQNPSYINQLGAGRINAQAAMSCISSTLSWAPQADFVANVTTISAGGSVSFTDQSIYNPTIWTWTFTGGSPASYNGQNPPNVSYAAPGTYTVSLQVSNGNGTDTETKTAYINVLAANSCDTLTNTQPGDNIYIYSYASPNGYFGGHNGYQITRWADKFTNTYPVGTYIHFIDYYFVEGMTNSSTAFITATIWDATGAGGSPGAVIASKNVLLQEIEDNQTGTGFYPTRVDFGGDVALPVGDFFIGYTLTMAAGDTVVLAANQDIAGVTGRSNTIWEYNAMGSGTWEDYVNYSTSEKNFHVYLYATTFPVSASMSPTTPSICSGDAVNFSSAGSTNATHVEWYFNGSPTDTTSQANPSVIYNVAGGYTQYLVAYNTCGYYDIDSTVVTVNATPAIAISTSADTICPSGSALLLASGAGTYAWTPATGLSNPAVANPTATPATTTTYTVVGTTGSCSDDASITIVVDQPPVADYSWSPNPVGCNGVPVVFDGSLSENASFYEWTFQNGSPASSSQIFPSVSFTTGSQNVKLVVENTCGDKDSTIYLVTIADNPQPNLGADTTMCLFTSLLLDAGLGYSSYVWVGGTSTTNELSVSSTSAGIQSYSVQVADANGCIGGDTVFVTYVVCATLDENNGEGVNVYPNPAVDKIFISGLGQISEITITNPAGQVVLKQTLVADGELDVSPLESGVYYLIVATDDSARLYKLIIGL